MLNVSNIQHGKLPHSPKVMKLAVELAYGYTTPEDLPALKVENVGSGLWKSCGGETKLAAFKLSGMKSIKVRYHEKI